MYYREDFDNCPDNDQEEVNSFEMDYSQTDIILPPENYYNHQYFHYYYYKNDLKFGKIWFYLSTLFYDFFRHSANRNNSFSPWTATSSVLLLLSLLLLGVFYYCVYRNYRHCPPGPWGMPFIGSLPYLSSFDVHYKLVELSKQYGKIFNVTMGLKNLVVISDAKMMKEAFAKEEFNGRPNNEFIKLLGGYGIVNVDGHIWKEQRRFLHSCLRSFGMSIFNKKNNSLLQCRIMTEVEALLSTLRERIDGDRPIDLNQYFAVSVSNVICSILMSVRFSFDDVQFRNLMFNIEEGFRLFGGISAINYFPFLRFFPFFSRGLRKIRQNKRQTDEFFQRIIEEHRRTFDGVNKRDLLDYYLFEIKKTQTSGKSDRLFDGKDHNTQMRQIVVDVFSAGMETTKTALHWSLIYTLHHPQVARAIQNELDQVVGRTRLPTFDDLPYLPYTEATILEVLRKSSVVPLGISHSNNRDVYFRGYRIPRNTEIVPLICAVNNDPTLWHEPELFKPERFLDSAGRISKPEYFIPFGIGRRNCLGEMLARMEIFTFFAAMLHTFDITIPKGHPLPNLEGNFGVTLSPCSYQILLKNRPLHTDK